MTFNWLRPHRNGMQQFEYIQYMEWNNVLFHRDHIDDTRWKHTNSVASVSLKFDFCILHDVTNHLKWLIDNWTIFKNYDWWTRNNDTSHYFTLGGCLHNILFNLLMEYFECSNLTSNFMCILLEYQSPNELISNFILIKVSSCQNINIFTYKSIIHSLKCAFHIRDGTYTRTKLAPKTTNNWICNFE